MFCKRCGKELKEGAQFCQYCGTKVAVTAGKTEESSVPRQPVEPKGAETERSASHTVTKPGEPVGKSGVVNKVVVGTVVAIVIIVIGVVLYLLMSKKRDDIETTGGASVGYEESGENSDSADQDSQEAVSSETPEPSDIPEALGSQDSAPTAVPESVQESPEEPVSQYVLPNSNSQYLTRADLTGLTKDELRIARNELYARYGRMFTDEALQAYFDACEWYSGTIVPGDFDDSVLNEYEKANRDLIVQYESEISQDATYYANWPEIVEFELSDGILTFSSDGGAEARYGWFNRLEPFSISFPVAGDCVWEHAPYGVHESDSSYEAIKEWLEAEQEDAEAHVREYGAEGMIDYVQSPFSITVEVREGQVVRVYTSAS